MALWFPLFCVFLPTSIGVGLSAKVWTCSDVPGQTVKMVSETTKPMKSKTTMELVEFKAAG